MSIEIDWQALTTGPDGLALADTIRDFIHDKFQNVTLPRFIRSVKVHSFEFGEQGPQVILKDICDPLDEFYEEDNSDESADEDNVEEEIRGNIAREAQPLAPNAVPRLQQPLGVQRGLDAHPIQTSLPTSRSEPQDLSGTTHRPGLRTLPSFVDQLASPLLSRSSTPGIPGGTSSLNHFHGPLSAGLSGTQTPLNAAFASAAANHTFPAPWSDYNFPHRPALPPSHRPEPILPPPADATFSTGDVSSRPTTANTTAHPLSHVQASGDYDRAYDAATEMPSSRQEPSPNDIQLVLHVSYEGNLRLALSAEILLDYPMSNFVNIPLQLTITGLSFDGVALVAYIRPPKMQDEDSRPQDRGDEGDSNDEAEERSKGRAHICFLGQEDAQALLGAHATNLGEDDANGEGAESPVTERGKSAERQKPSQPGKPHQAGEHAVKHYLEQKNELGGLFKEIRVESEIGQRAEGRQSLKNVGKVEKFVLEQVRKIFEDEFVWPSFWTFLL